MDSECSMKQSIKKKEKGLQGRNNIRKQCECCNLLIWLLKLISAACVCKNRAKFKNGGGTDLWYCCLKSEVGDVILSRVNGNKVDHDLGFCLFVTLDLQAQSILLVD